MLACFRFLGVVALVVGTVASPLFGQNGPEQQLARADKLYLGDKLFEAEAVYRNLLATGMPDVVRRSYDQLLAIYTQVSRHDELVRTATNYREFLKNRDALRDSELDLEFGTAYFYLGHLNRSREYLEKALTNSRAERFDPLKRFAAIGVLAQIAEKDRKHDRAVEYWKQLQSETQNYLKNSRVELKPADKIRTVWRLAESYLAVGEPDKAIDQLQKLIPVHDGLRDLVNKRDTLRRTADANYAAKRYSFAAKNLLDALELHRRVEPNDRLTSGLIYKQLTQVARATGDPAEGKLSDEAKRYQELATEEFQFVLRNPGSGQKEIAGAVAAFWELEELYRSVKQFRQALRLSEEQAAQWVDGSLILPRIRLQQGGLETIQNFYPKARANLEASLKDIEKQQPVNLIELPRLYNNLALVELQLEGAEKAEGYASKSIKLYGDNKLPTDLTLVEAHNILGNAQAQQGNYKEGIDSFEGGAKLCAELGDIAKVQRSYLLLNVAILLKSQGKGDQAIARFLEAKKIYQSVPNGDELVLGAFDAALANIYTGNPKGGNLTAAGDLGRSLKALCERRGVDRGPLVTAWKHSLALESLAHARKSLSVGDTPAADKAYQQAWQLWDELRQLQEKEKQAVLLPRTLNFLGICCEMQGKDADAAKYFSEARSKQANNPRAFPQTNFITHWRAARLLDRDNKPADALKVLADGIEIVEKARTRTFGAGEDRADFFQQFETAFELYIDWAVRDGKLDEAFLAACRGRSRSLFDQLQLSRVDPTKGLEVSHKAELEKEQTLLKRLSALRAQAQLVPAEAIGTERAKQILDEFYAAQDAYAANHTAILNASPVYRALSDDRIAKTSLDTIRKEILDDETILLVYHIGRENSYVLLLTNKGETSSAHRLQINQAIADQIIQPEFVALVDGTLPTTRGMKIVSKAPPTGDAPTRESLGPIRLGPLGQGVAKFVVEHYWQYVTSQSFFPSRGMKVATRTPNSLSTQRFDLLGDIFLPPELRQKIVALRAKRMIVIPDGPLHKLPLESMLLEAGPKPVYVIDEMPPIVYAPSAAILTILGGSQRPRIDPTTPATLLTLSNPAYDNRCKRGDLPESVKDVKTLQLFGKLQSLEGSEKEAKRIRAFFDEANVVSLDGVNATEGKFRAALKGQRFIHIAAHGFADDRYSNAFGALLLTPPAPQVKEPPPDDDGLLELNEIYALPLRDTELSVLSACLTNAGPQQPLEAGVTLASGFLCAGSRNVVASNWSVDDDATALLMDYFFQEIMKSTRRGEHPDYPLALQTARKKVRDNPRYALPYYWAPFVIIGQAR